MGIELHIEPKQKDLGEGFKVRRSLPDFRKRMVGPFVFWDHMGPATFLAGQDLEVRAHPHIGLATLTYLFAGEMMHRDSLGNVQAIKPGEVNWMTAGRGISHSERTHSGNQEVTLEGIQLWLALPKDKEEIAPDFYHAKEDALPQIEGQGYKARLIAGNYEERTSPVPVYSDLFYLELKVDNGWSFPVSLDAEREAAVYVVDGCMLIEGKEFHRFDMVILSKGTKLELHAKGKEDGKLQLMFFGGAPFPEKRHIWWNFVSTNKDRIEQAKKDWTEGKFGKVAEEDSWIPLPEN